MIIAKTNLYFGTRKKRFFFKLNFCKMVFERLLTTQGNSFLLVSSDDEQGKNNIQSYHRYTGKGNS